MLQQDELPEQPRSKPDDATEKDPSNQHKPRRSRRTLLLALLAVVVGVVVVVRLLAKDNQNTNIHEEDSIAGQDPTFPAPTTVDNDNDDVGCAVRIHNDVRTKLTGTLSSSSSLQTALEGYTGDEWAVAQTILAMGETLLIRLIASEAQYYFCSSSRNGLVGPYREDDNDDSDVGGDGTTVAGMATAAQSQSRVKKSLYTTGTTRTPRNKEENYGTNSQGDTEGDFIVSDGRHVYAALGRTVLVWEALTGRNVTQIHVEDTILSLLLEQDRLVIFTHSLHRDDNAEELPGFSILFSSRGARTNILLYDISAMNSIRLIGSKTVPGLLQASHHHNSTGSAQGSRFAHIVTVAEVLQSELYFETLFSQNPAYSNPTEREFVAASAKHASEVVLPLYVSRVMQDLSRSSALPKLVGNVWQSHATLAEPDAVRGSVWSLAMVTVFDLATSSSDIPISTSGTFIPCRGVAVFSSDSNVVVAGYPEEGLQSVSDGFREGDTTFLLSFSLDGLSASPTAFGSVQGLMMLSSVVDFDGSYIRIATTRFDDPDVVGTVNKLFILEVPVSTDGEPVEMIQRGSIQLGKPGEVIASTRYFGDLAYAVTNLDICSFYVLDLSNPASPRILGELEITGCPAYLHPMNEDNTLILATGTDADEDGLTIGIYVTVFDISEEVNPKVAVRNVMEKSGDFLSSAFLDHKAFRYVKVTDDSGKLIIPLGDRRDTVNFQVFDISETQIMPLFNMTHSSKIYASPFDHDDSAYTIEGCEACNIFQVERSFVFGDIVNTVSSQSAMSANLTSGDLVWEETLEHANCCV